MSIFTIKRHLLFLRVVCCLFILYNIQNANHHYYATLQSTHSSGLGPIVDLFFGIDRYAHRNILAILILLLINMAGIISAICALMIKAWARKWLIALFYITIAIKALQFLCDSSELYWYYTTRVHYSSYTEIIFDSFTCFRSVFTIPIFIVTLFWVIKQFKSDGMKQLFKPKQISKTEKI